MRIDEIDLFGPLLVNGSTGSNGQVFGFSGSQITWITASASGDGLPGPQGPVGIGLFVTQDQVALGGDTGLTSTSFFKISGTNIIHGSASVGGNRNTILGSHQFTNPSAYQNIINGGNYNTILGGRQNSISSSDFSIIGGGENVNLSNQQYSASLGGKENQLTSSTFVGFNNTILGGNNNIISSNLGQSCNNSILGGYTSTIGSGISNGSCYSSIISSDSSGLSIAKSKGSAIIGGGNHNLDSYSVECVYSSAILGGFGNLILKSNPLSLVSYYTLNSVIISSRDSCSCTTRGVIISGNNKLLALYNCQGPSSQDLLADNVIIGNGRIGNYSMFNTYTNTNCSFCPGTFFKREAYGKNSAGFVAYCGGFPSMCGKTLTICF